MKKLLLGFMFFALVITSCNKYADDFQALKDQIAALSTKVDGVAALQAQLTATTAQVSAIQTAVNALPATIAGQFATVNSSLATITTKIADITTTLNTVAASGLATKGVVDGLKVTLDKVVADKVIADAALTTKLNALQADLVAKIAEGTTANAAAIAAAQSAILAQVTASATSTDANVNAKLAAAKLALETLINANMATTNANTDAKVAAAQAAINAYTLAQLNQVKTDLTTSLNNGLAITDGKIALLAAQLATGLAGVDIHAPQILTAHGVDAEPARGWSRPAIPHAALHRALAAGLGVLQTRCQEIRRGAGGGTGEQRAPGEVVVGQVVQQLQGERNEVPEGL